MKALEGQGVTGLSSSAKARPGYHGVNIKGLYQGTPVEMQVNPGRISNMGAADGARARLQGQDRGPTVYLR